MPFKSRQETLDRFQADMGRLLGAVDGLSARLLTSTIYGDWTVKEVPAHIAAWDRLLAESVDDVLAGKLPALTAHASPAGETAFNEQTVRARRETSFDAVLADLRDAHETLVRRIEALSGDDWARVAPYRWWNGRPMTVASLFDYSYRGETHYGGHAKELEGCLAGR